MPRDDSEDISCRSQRKEGKKRDGAKEEAAARGVKGEIEIVISLDDRRRARLEAQWRSPVTK